VPVQVGAFSGYSEGIVFDAAGVAYVSLLHRNQVVRLRPGAEPQTWTTVEAPNGHKILRDGTHLVAAKHGVLHLRRDGTIIDTAAAHFEGRPLRGPNDIALDGHGGFYFTDPSQNDADAVARRGQVFYVDARRSLRLAAADFCYPNGILVRADGRVLYVNDSCTSHVYAFDITAPGGLTNRRIFAALPDSGRAALDGMAEDEDGHLFVAHYGVGRVEVLDSAGVLVRRYAAGTPLSSNVAFGGPKLDELFVTGAPGAESGPGVLTRLPLTGVRGRSSRSTPRAGR
jgi:gluconolactonase